MELTDLRKLQLLEVNLLQKFQEICEENQLNYYFVGGGLIGALRHGGFIPWDDDMDIVMPREDYDKFVEICKRSGVENGYGLIHYETIIDPNWHTVYSQFVDVESVIERPWAYGSQKQFVWIDIMAIDGTPNCKIRRWLHMKHILMLRYWLVLTDIKHIASKKKRPFYEDWVLWFFNIVPLFKIFKTNQVAQILESSMRKYKMKDSEFWCDYMGKYRSREIQPKERWGNPVTLLFEGIEVKVPELYHEFQTHMYGDYMKLPPENERIAHEAILLKHRNIDFDKMEMMSKKSRLSFSI